MAATETVRQLPELLQPRHGVVTLFGYGISVRVNRGHLVLQDGIGPSHREARFSRVGHGLKRLVVIVHFAGRFRMAHGSGCGIHDARTQR